MKKVAIHLINTVLCRANSVEISRNNGTDDNDQIGNQNIYIYIEMGLDLKYWVTKNNIYLIMQMLLCRYLSWLHKSSRKLHCRKIFPNTSTLPSVFHSCFLSFSDKFFRSSPLASFLSCCFVFHSLLTDPLPPHNSEKEKMFPQYRQFRNHTRLHLTDWHSNV